MLDVSADRNESESIFAGTRRGVAHARRREILEAISLDIASPDEARALLDLKGSVLVGFSPAIKGAQAAAASRSTWDHGAAARSAGPGQTDVKAAWCKMHFVCEPSGTSSA